MTDLYPPSGEPICGNVLRDIGGIKRVCQRYPDHRGWRPESHARPVSGGFDVWGPAEPIEAA